MGNEAKGLVSSRGLLRLLGLAGELAGAKQGQDWCIWVCVPRGPLRRLCGGRRVGRQQSSGPCFLSAVDSALTPHPGAGGPRERQLRAEGREGSTWAVVKGPLAGASNFSR